MLWRWYECYHLHPFKRTEVKMIGAIRGMTHELFTTAQEKIAQNYVLMKKI